MKPEDFKIWRKRMGMTQTVAGDALGISKRQIIFLENGKSKISKSIQISCNCIENHKHD